MSAPLGARDNQYLKDCIPEGQLRSMNAFCRKSTFKIEATGEKRVVRSCGYIPEASSIAGEKEAYCLQADSEGLDQRICSCYADGCNSGPFSVSRLSFVTLILTLALSLLVKKLL